MSVRDTCMRLARQRVIEPGTWWVFNPSNDTDTQIVFCIEERLRFENPQEYFRAACYSRSDIYDAEVTEAITAHELALLWMKAEEFWAHVETGTIRALVERSRVS